MPAPRRKNLIASRRRRQDDGEEEGSAVGDFDDDSVSEGSAVSNGEGGAAAGSESSDDERESIKPDNNTQHVKDKDQARDAVLSLDNASYSHGPFRTTSDTQAMLHGVRATGTQEREEIHFNDLGVNVENAEGSFVSNDVSVPTAPRNETLAQRSRREHQEYIRQRNANPAFVPNRGGFFLHDDRNAGSHGSPRPFIRGRGRGFGPAVQAGRGNSVHEPTEMPWAHDLHERHESAPKSDPNMPKVEPATSSGQVDKPVSSSAPNRTFSFVTVLGNVTVQISLPGMEQKKLVPNVVKRHHTLLPQHRPPLRRDKPVRISIPNEAPRYIFPSTERSFIFIPRALRPNQQYGRGRGRGSFHGSRRPSVYGSTYTPSVAMSRKSSMGGSIMRDGIRSPAESVVSRMAIPGVEASRPIVRMPSAVPTPSLSRTGFPIMNGNMGMPPNHVNLPPAYGGYPGGYPGSYSTTIPMHQPRPQKTVSLADIESPASFQFKAPQQQQEQPFHQQVPAHMANVHPEDRRAQPIAAPVAAPGALSQIPEGAIYAPGFQPYPTMTAPPFFGAPYSNGPMFYPQVADGGPYGVPMTGPALAPNFVPGSQAHHVGYMSASGPVEGGVPANVVPHESNGMVYYYNPPMFTPDPQGGFPVASNGNMVTMANGMPGQHPFYYSSMPTGMYYPAQSG